MSLWYIVLVYVLANGQVASDVRYPNDPTYNGVEVCNQAGDALMRLEQEKLGKEGTVYYICKELTPEQYRKATVKGQDI